MKTPGSFELPGLKGWTFSLALHGARLQLEARSATTTWSTWMEPTEDPRDAADRLRQRPSCCLL